MEENEGGKENFLIYGLERKKSTRKNDGKVERVLYDCETIRD